MIFIKLQMSSNIDEKVHPKVTDPSFTKPQLSWFREVSDKSGLIQNANISGVDPGPVHYRNYRRVRGLSLFMSGETREGKLENRLEVLNAASGYQRAAGERRGGSAGEAERWNRRSVAAGARKRELVRIFPRVLTAPARRERRTMLSSVEAQR